jgi:hypothetical protein
MKIFQNLERPESQVLVVPGIWVRNSRSAVELFRFLFTPSHPQRQTSYRSADGQPWSCHCRKGFFSPDRWREFCPINVTTIKVETSPHWELNSSWGPWGSQTPSVIISVFLAQYIVITWMQCVRLGSSIPQCVTRNFLTLSSQGLGTVGMRCSPYIKLWYIIFR